MKKILSVAALAMLVGCGMSEDSFKDKSLEATCQWLVDCFSLFADVDTCISESDTGTVDESCEYDAKKAKECVDDLEALTCDDTEAPASCLDVYTDCDTGM